MSRVDRRARLALVLAGAFTLTACAVGPDYREPETAVAERFDAEALVTGARQGEI
jgi:hypothetical protein